MVWDWNGTLLDDVEAGLATVNVVLDEQGRPQLADADAYRGSFGFPVREFYRRIGFDTDDDFLTASHRYLEVFPTHVAAARLQDGAGEVLAALAARGLRQVLASATLDEVLTVQMAPHGITDHFETVIGVPDGAENPSKMSVVAAWLRSSGLQPGEVVMVGDTNHDEQIAEALGTRFIRFAGGHQAVPENTPWPVTQTLAEVPALV